LGGTLSALPRLGAFGTPGTAVVFTQDGACEIMTTTELIEKAIAIAHSRQLTDECTVGEVGAALLTSAGSVFTGVSISAASGVGFCAEHSAVAQMITAGETRIQKVVAVSANGKVLPPCGRCREILFQVDRGNLEAEIVLGRERIGTLAELLPERWQEL
jgi:cytidine deaminase